MSDDKPTTSESPNSDADGGGAGANHPQAGDTAPPTVLSRKELRAQDKSGSPLKWWVLGGAAVVVLGVVPAVLLTGGTTSAAKRAVPPATSTTHPAGPVATCPLTGTPAPGGAVPRRPALAVKIGNYTDDRPSAGLNQADIVFEEPVEGSYTRLVAVFQCQGSSLVGDMRSARQPDVAILSQLSNPIFLHAGGINPVLGLLARAPLQDKNILEGGYDHVILHPGGRYAPYATFTSTGPAWGLSWADVSPPAPIFAYSAVPPAGSIPGSGIAVHVPFSSTSDVTWTWDPVRSTYLRSYAGVPDKLVDGSQTAAADVVILTVPTFYGPWLENSEGAHEVEVTATGSGPLVVLRNGIAITGTWTRHDLNGPTALVATDGTPITLQPGNTWEELAPQGTPVTVTAAPPPPATSVPTSATTKAASKTSSKSPGTTVAP